MTNTKTTTIPPTPWKIIKLYTDYASPGQAPNIAVTEEVHDARGARVSLTGGILERIVDGMNALRAAPPSPPAVPNGWREWIVWADDSHCDGRGVIQRVSLSEKGEDGRDFVCVDAKHMDDLNAIAAAHNTAMLSAAAPAQPAQGDSLTEASDLPSGLVLVATPYRTAPDKWMLIEMTGPGRAKVITGGYIETEAEGVAHAHNFAGTSLCAARSVSPAPVVDCRINGGRHSALDVLRDMTALFEMTDEAQQPGTDSYTVLKQAHEVLRSGEAHNG